MHWSYIFLALTHRYIFAGNDMSPTWYQAITRSYAELIVCWILWNTFKWNFIQNSNVLIAEICCLQYVSHFYPRPVLAFGYCRCLRVCVCVCLSVNHQLVRAITHQPFKLEPPNLDQRCKRPWLRSLLFFGAVDLELQGQIELKCQNLPHFELVRAISHHQLKSVFPNFGQKCIFALLRSLLILGWIDLDVLYYF